MFHKQFNSLQYRRGGDLKSQGYKEKTKRVHSKLNYALSKKEKKKMNQRSAINSKTYAFFNQKPGGKLCIEGFPLSKSISGMSMGKKLKRY